MSPTRQVYFNVTGVWLMYVLLAITLAVFGYGIYRRWRLWQIGRPVARFDRIGERLQRLLRQGPGHKKLLQRYAAAGFAHLLIFWGFVFLFLGTVVVFIHEDLHIHIMQGKFYLYFQSLTLNIFGILCIAGILIDLVQRYVTRPRRLKPDKPDDAIILLSILTILVTGFMIQGLRIQLTHDPWAAWSPIGNFSGGLFASFLSEPSMYAAHRALWWFHLVVVFSFIGWIPYSKLFHIFTATASLFTQSLEPRGTLPLLNLENENEPLGVSRLENFTWKDLLDLDACTECGRCEVNCPAFLTDKPLSPKWLILDARESLHRETVVMPSQPSDGESPLVGPVIRPETLWSCTTCGACMEQCPVAIEHIPKIIGMRRHLTMERAEFPDDLENMVRSLEARGHPYPGSSASRTDWMQGLSLTQLADQPAADFDVLLWVGCAGALNQRSQSVTRSTAELLQRAGVKFAVLGREERCTGDPARRIGHEFLFQTLAQQNISTLDRYKTKKIVTSCPHCFNSFRNDYPQLGGNYEVIHHSEFLNDLLSQGKLKPSHTRSAKMTFHDPCYLGRHNQVYEPPREVLDQIPGVNRSEPDWNKRNALCCGGGGGFSFMEEKSGSRMNQNRTRQLLETGAETIAVGCPFCMIMLEDGVKTATGENGPRVRDIAEVLKDATDPGKS
jgi:Fe-S oxidoreductase/nitrate reductase gamma subunit